MLEIIRSGKGSIIAIILRRRLRPKEITFYTPPEFSQQLGLLRHKKGYFIRPHQHKILHREVAITQEVLHIRRGKIKVLLYDEDRRHIATRILKTGDSILLAAGGHGVKVLKETLMLEVKQGPYPGSNDMDKEYIGDKL